MALHPRGYLLESDIGEGPLFPDDKVPPGLTFERLIKIANQAQQNHYELADQFKKEECADKLLQLLDCFRSRQVLTSLCRTQQINFTSCKTEVEQRLLPKINEWTRNNIRKYGQLVISPPNSIKQDGQSAVSYLCSLPPLCAKPLQ